MSKVIDLIGKVFGRLTVIERVENNKSGRSMWRCRCECGKECIVLGKYLLNGGTRSCGCLKVEELKKRSSSHKMSNTPLYKKWQIMNTRCNNSNRDHYQWYGGKGIKVCEEWRKFENFYNWAMENGYSDGLTIERVDISKDYEPNNCKWITLKEQSFNKANTRWLSFNGKTQSLTKWAEELELPISTLKTRIYKYKWSIEKALTTPIDPNKWKSKRT
jgi:hypothetical protein